MGRRLGYGAAMRRFLQSGVRSGSASAAAWLVGVHP